ncbi:thioesterase domain-containing protein, partial [Mycobacterium marinum]|uniref:thioesterase domain-containing protein n=2 Tax=Mycobacterium marinum TaxID=1781 RepID=UPI003566F5BE
YTTSAQAYLAPQGPVEETLASLYAQILGGSDRVSAADSFFELGGDSLSAMRLIAATNTTLHTDLRVADIFDTPTITTLAHRIDTHAQPATIPPIQTLHTGTGTPLFCIHATSGISWPYQTLATHLTNPLIGINQTLNADETPPHTLQAMARNYATRIQNTHPTGPYYLLGWSFGGVLAHQIAIELHHRGHTDTRLILLDSLPTLDTNTDPTITPRNDRQTLQTLLGHHHTTIPDDQLHHLTTNHNHNITLYQHHQPHTYTGPTLLIAAEHTPPPNHPTYESTHTKAAYLLHAWQPHLTGPTTTHSTNCTHHQLLHPNHTPTYTNHLKNFLQ